MDKFQKGKKIINKSIARKNLKEIYEVFNRNNIPLILIFGTLLGAVRENDFISYDNDIDLAAFWKDRERILKVIKEELPTFKIQPIPYEYDINLIRNDEKTEIWLFDDLGDVYCYDPERQPTLRYSKHFFDNAMINDFLGIKTLVPFNAKEFLTITYGPTWVTPNPNGSYILK
jgi:glycerol-3-phosphate cytidylyltransferase